MDRAWWLKASLILALILLAVGALVPTLAGPKKGEPVPDWYTSYSELWNNKLNLGLDLQGGLLLQYRVEVEKAVLDKADRMEDDMVKRLKKADPEVKVTTRREGQSTVVLKFEDPAKAEKLLTQDFLSFFPALVRKDLGSGEIQYTMSPEYIEQTQEYAVTQAIGTITKRIDALGVAEPDIKKSGKSDVVIQLPGLGEEDFERAKTLIGMTAQLEFKMVAEKDIPTVFNKYRAEMPVKDFAYTDEGTLKPGKADIEFTNETGEPALKSRSKSALKAFLKGKVDSKFQVVYEEIVRYTDKTKTVIDENNSYWRTHMVFANAELTGDYIADARIDVDQRTRKPTVSLTFDSTGAEIFGKITTENVNKRFGIILDDVIKSDPVINEPITGGRAQITLGGYKATSELYSEANALVIALRNGALPAPIHKQFETSVGPSLGEDSIRKGTLALSLACGFVILFMLVYYKLGGVIANFALILNMLFIIAGLTALNATLTLPGIAGIILTIGMAVDANVIIFERIKEELRLARKPSQAIDLGYGKALSAVLDANITTGIAGLVLMQAGTGPIRGFAITLLIGIISSVFTAVIVTRLCYDFILRKYRPKSLSI